VAWLCWLYVALVLAVWALLATASDEWWPATLLMFLPRWLCAVPLLVLAPLAAWRRPRMQWILLGGGIVIAWPLMGFSIPWNRLSGGPTGQFRCRVLTCNVHRNPWGVKAVIDKVKPDVVALQDCPERFNPQGVWEGDWHIQSRGQFLLASRYPIRAFTALEPPHVPPDTVVLGKLETTVGVIRFYVLHLESPRDGLMAIRQHGFSGGGELQVNSNTRRSQSKAIDAWIATEAGPLLVAGDFNTPPDSTIYGAFWSKYTNAFSEGGLGWGYTYFASRTALRIDHILAGPGWRCRDCWVGPEVGSEHRPVIADIEWFGAER
jgi:endonuclease/exonuclease/phosphatase family metal-dependent hydrolase